MIHTLSVSIHNISLYDTKTYICEEQEPNVPVIASSLYSLDGYNYTYDSSDDEEEEKPKVFNDFIDPIYRHSFEFGAMNIPAISVLITVTPKISLYESYLRYKEEENHELMDQCLSHLPIENIAISISLGTIEILPTPWIWDVFDLLDRYKAILDQLAISKVPTEPVVHPLPSTQSSIQDSTTLTKSTPALFSSMESEPSTVQTPKSERILI